MKPDERSPAPALARKVPGPDVLSSSQFISLGAAAEGAVSNFAPLYVAKRYGLPLTVARVVCELAAIGRRLG